MEIQAVTICINYADYLASTVANRDHFDAWTIVTVQGDDATHRLCEQYSLDLVESSVAGRRGERFDAAYQKAAILNEALNRFDSDVWIVTLDADTLLPPDFRERLNSLPLDYACLYGLAGRRICESEQACRLRSSRLPWRDFIERKKTIIGYFNLFHSSVVTNRYPVACADSSRERHDDWNFQESFLPECRKILPINAIHAGPVAVNWSRRVSDRFESPESTIDDLDQEAVPDTFFDTIAQDGDARAAALVGYYPGDDVREFSVRFDRVFLVDGWCIDVGYRADAMVEADRKCSRRLFNNQTTDLNNLAYCGSHCDSNLKQIPDGSLDTVFFSGETNYDLLLSSVPHWLRKLKPGGVFAGAFFGHPDWPEVSVSVSLVLGTPDQVFEDSYWIKRPVPEKLLQSAAPLGFGERQVQATARTTPLIPSDRGVVYVIKGKKSVENLLISLHSLRHHWTGAVLLMNCGEEIPALRIACLHYNVNFLQIPASGRLLGHKPPTHRTQMERLYALQLSPFEQTCLLTHDSVVTAEIDGLFDLMGEEELMLIEGDDNTDPKSSELELWREAGFSLEEKSAVAFSLDVMVARSGFDARERIEKWLNMSWKAIRAGLPDAEVNSLAFLLDRGEVTMRIIDRKWATNARNGSPGSPAAIVWYPDGSLQEDLELCELWAEQEEMVLRRMSPEILCGTDLTVVTLVDEHSLPDFYRSWFTWKFRDGARERIIVYRGLSAEDFFFVEKDDTVTIMALTSKSGRAAVAEFFLLVAEIVNTTHWVFLPPWMQPLPGANLFASPTWKKVDFATTTTKSKSVRKSGLPVSFALFRTDLPWLSELRKRNYDPLRCTRRRKWRLASVEPGDLGWVQAGEDGECDSLVSKKPD